MINIYIQFSGCFSSKLSGAYRKKWRKYMDRLVRTSAKALVIKDGCMLAIKLHDSDGDFYIMPGGGQAAGELLPATVQREVAEETGISVRAKDAKASHYELL